MKKVSSSTVSIFSFKVAEKKRVLPARAKAGAQRTVSPEKVHFASKEEHIVLATLAERSPLSSTPGESRWLRVRPSTKLSHVHLAPASTPPPQKKRHLSSASGLNDTTPVLKSANRSVVGSSSSRRAGRGWRRRSSSGGCKEDASDPERARTVTCTQAKKQNLKHGQFADCVLKSYSVGCESRQYPADVAVSMELKRSSRLPLVLRDDHLESLTFYLVALFWSTFTPNEHPTNVFFIVEELRYLREAVRLCSAYQYIRKQCWIAAMSLPSRRRLQQVTSRGPVVRSLRNEKHKLLTGGMPFCQGLDPLFRLHGKFFSTRTTPKLCTKGPSETVYSSCPRRFMRRTSCGRKKNEHCRVPSSM